MALAAATQVISEDLSPQFKTERRNNLDPSPSQPPHKANEETSSNT